MKLLIAIDKGEELYGAGDDRYMVKTWSAGWANMNGIDIKCEAYKFTSAGWTLVFQHEDTFARPAPPKRYSDKAKAEEQEAIAKVKTELLSWLTAFHDG